LDLTGSRKYWIQQGDVQHQNALNGASKFALAA